MLSLNPLVVGQGKSLTENDIKEELSYACVHAVASRAGFALDYRRKDRDSVDVIISSKRPNATLNELQSVSLELQVKATAFERSDGNRFSFELPIKNYNELKVRTLCPRLLVVLALPTLNSQWLTMSEDSLILRHCLYWHNLKGQPAVENKKSKTVWISRTNVFTPETLTVIMEKVARFEEIGRGL